MKNNRNCCKEEQRSLATKTQNTSLPGMFIQDKMEEFVKKDRSKNQKYYMQIAMNTRLKKTKLNKEDG